jgi:hypothetical protein
LTTVSTAHTVSRPAPGLRSPSQRLTANTSRYQLLDQLLVNTPWSVRDLQNLLVRSAIGLALIAGGWVGVSSTPEWGTQLIWIGIGLGGAVVAAITGVGWLLNGLASVSSERTIIRHAIADRIATRTTPAEDSAVVPSDEDTLVNTGALVTASGMRYFHRPTCQTVQGKPLERLTFAESMHRELEPCRMCRP